MRYSIFSNSDCPILNISSIGYAYDTSVTRFGPGVRNSYIIHYVLSGKGYFNGNSISAGQGFLITPNTQECYFPDEKEPWEFLWIISDDHKMAKLFMEYNPHKTSQIFTYSYTDAIKTTADFLIKNSNTKYSGYEILEIFLRFFKYQSKAFPSAQIETNADIYIKAAVKYVELNLQNSITVSELTDFLGVSQPYLFKIFKEHFSVSPKKYITVQKLLRAKALLHETDLSVTYIANSVGFPDVLSFSKCFKQNEGVSPQNYRKSLTD